MILNSILAAMGMATLDANLDSLMEAMKQAPIALQSLSGWARTIGIICALCVGSYESWMMMLGRRGMDVMKILRIIGFSICISASGSIAAMLKAPGEAFETSLKTDALKRNELVANKEAEVAQLQQKYLQRLREINDSLEIAKQTERSATSEGIIDDIVNSIENLWDQVHNTIKEAAFAMESKVTEWVNTILRFIGECILQMTYYGLFIAQRCFMNIMIAFLPLMFALSLAPPWSSAWSQWISKFVTLSMWGGCIYAVLIYVDQLMIVALDTDIETYQKLIGGSETTWGNIGALGLQGIGTTCQYVMAMLAGSKVLSMVPECASWLIPGGVSSSAGSSAGGVATAAAVAAKNTVMNTVVSKSAPVRQVAGYIGDRAARNLSHNNLQNLKMNK